MLGVQKAKTVGNAMTELESGSSVRPEPFWPAAIITFGISLAAAWIILMRTNQASRARDLAPLVQKSESAGAALQISHATISIDGSIAASSPQRN